MTSATAAGALAHTTHGPSGIRLHSLAEHLLEVARLAGGRFRLIDDGDQVSVFVRYRGRDGQDATVEQRLAQLRGDGSQRWLLRALQRYTVSVHQRDALRFIAQVHIEELIPGLFVQVSDVLYDPVLGLRADPAGPVPLIV